MSRGHDLRVEMPGTLEGVDDFCGQFRHWYRETGPATSRFAVELLLREALTNAVKYGAGPGVPVTCLLRGGRNRLVIAVRDQGAGFDWKSVSRRAPEDEPATGGRGLEIFRRYADRVRFNQQGNALVLVKLFRQPARTKEMHKMINDTSTTVLRPTGDVVASAVPGLRAEMRDLVQAGTKQLIVDLRNVHMVDSAGLGLLIAAHNSLKKIGGEMSVIQASADILELLTTLRMNQHFSIQGQ
ncbi:MAG: ATP-binding protein [Acidobacteria bacterium]|nr:ATP-binding protein [Acidobacteriota bacterium]